MGSDLKNKICAAAAVAVLAALPLFVSSSYWLGALIVCFIYGIWAVSLDFMSGLTGRINFGHTLFIGAAAYTAAFLGTGWGVGAWVGMFWGVVAAVLLSFVIGLPTLRLHGAYFVLAMLTATLIMQRLTRVLWEYTGGEDGIPGLEPMLPTTGQMYYLCLAVLTVVTTLLVVLAKSRWGLLLRGIRGDEAACRAAGINVTFFKMAALVISAAFAGVGGVLFTHFQGAATPEMFGVALAVTIIIMAYVGGLGSIWGAAVAALILALLPETMRGLGQYRIAIYCIILLLIAFFAPQGLVAPLWRRLTERAR